MKIKKIVRRFLFCFILSFFFVPFSLVSGFPEVLKGFCDSNPGGVLVSSVRS